MYHPEKKCQSVFMPQDIKMSFVETKASSAVIASIELYSYTHFLSVPVSWLHRVPLCVSICMTGVANVQKHKCPQRFSLYFSALNELLYSKNISFKRSEL